MKILFLGNSYNPVSITCLEALSESNHQIIAGMYSPLSRGLLRVAKEIIRKEGFGFLLRKTTLLIRTQLRIMVRRIGISIRGPALSLHECLEAKAIETIACTNPNSPEFVGHIRRLGVDLIVVAAFSKILKSSLVEAPKVGCINIHPSLLPRYRGPNPYYWVLANNESETGVTIHYIDEGIDSGCIIAQRKLQITPQETEISLQNRSAHLSATLLREVLPLLETGTAPAIRQDESQTSYFSFPPKGASKL